MFAPAIAATMTPLAPLSRTVGTSRIRNERNERRLVSACRHPRWRLPQSGSPARVLVRRDLPWAPVWGATHALRKQAAGECEQRVIGLPAVVFVNTHRGGYLVHRWVSRLRNDAPRQTGQPRRMRLQAWALR